MDLEKVNAMLKQYQEHHNQMRLIENGLKVVFAKSVHWPIIRDTLDNVEFQGDLKIKPEDWPR